MMDCSAKEDGSRQKIASSATKLPLTNKIFLLVVIIILLEKKDIIRILSLLPTHAAPPSFCSGEILTRAINPSGRDVR